MHSSVLQRATRYYAPDDRLFYATLRVCSFVMQLTKRKLTSWFSFKFDSIDLNSITLFVRSFTYLFVVVSILYSWIKMSCCIVGIIVSSGKVLTYHIFCWQFLFFLLTINRFNKTILNNLTDLEFSLLQPSNKETSTFPAQPRRKDCADRRRVSARL